MPIIFETLVARKKTPGQAAHCVAIVPKINREDVKKLQKVAYLGPGYEERLWFDTNPLLDAR